MRVNVALWVYIAEAALQTAIIRIATRTYLSAVVIVVPPARKRRPEERYWEKRGSEGGRLNGADVGNWIWHW